MGSTHGLIDWFPETWDRNQAPARSVLLSGTRALLVRTLLSESWPVLLCLETECYLGVAGSVWTEEEAKMGVTEGRS